MHYQRDKTYMVININVKVQKWVISPDPISLDRIDFQVQVQPLSFEEMSNTTPSESSLSIRERVLKARTIADYEGCADITSTHIAEAISYRNLDRSTWGQR